MQDRNRSLDNPAGGETNSSPESDAAATGREDRSAVRLAISLAVGVLLDVAMFQLVSRLGGGLASAHMAGFYSAVGLSYLLNRFWVFRVDGGAQSLWMVVIALFAVLMRGAVIDALVERAGWSVSLALCMGIATAILVQAVGALWFVLTPAHAETPGARWRKWAVALFAYSLCLRLAYSVTVELLPEEAYYWSYAQHPALSYLDHPPLVGWVIWLGTRVFGNNEFGIRIGTILVSVITAGWLVGFTRNLYGHAAAMGALLISASLPFLLLTGFLATPDALLVASWAGTLYFLERAILGERRIAWLGAGLCLGLGLLSKYTIILLVPATLLMLLLDRRSRGILRRPDPYVAGALALLVFAPVLIWNLRHEWVSFTFQGTRRMANGFGISLPSLVLDAMILLTPPGFVLALRAVTRVVPPDTVPSRRRRRFVASVTLVPLTVFVVYSLLHRDFKLNWTIPVWLGVVPGMALLLRRIWSSESRPALAWAWKGTLVFCLLIAGTLWHTLTIGLPGDPMPHSLHIPSAWQEMAHEVDLISAQVESETGQRPMVVDAANYQLAGLMSFYGRESRDGIAFTSGSNLLGGAGVMFEFWTHAPDHDGESMVLVSMKRKDLLSIEKMSYHRQLSEIRECEVQRRGRTRGRFFYRIGTGYESSGLPASRLP